MWTVDEFHGPHSGLVLAEIELRHEAAPFEKPSWLGKDVTRVEKYRQSALLKLHRKSVQLKA